MRATHVHPPTHAVACEPDVPPDVRAVWPASARWLPGGDISIAGVRLSDIAAEYGSPLNVLDLDEFRTRCKTYRDAFPDAEVAYAGKALLTRALVHLIDEQGLALDVCSEGELALAVSEGFPAGRIILHGNAKSRTLLALARTLRVGRIVVDSIEEIEMLARTPGSAPQNVLVRVTPGVDAGTHQAITTGTEDQKFGLSIRSGAAALACRRILELPSLCLVGVHCHIGSQISAAEPYVETVRRVVSFSAGLRDQLGVTLAQLNVGGGHAIAYTPADAPLAATHLATEVRRVLKESCSAFGLPMPQLTVEPGRAIAGPSGVTVYTVLGVKYTDTRTWVAVDGGMSDNPRPALYGATYTAQLLGRASSAPPAGVTVVGRHCEAGDVLVRDATLPADVRVGDLLAVPATGAYHHVMASNYNLTPRLPLVGVELGRRRLLVRRETFADLLCRDLG
jgi:diaminopimelate decarboxylase